MDLNKKKFGIVAICAIVISVLLVTGLFLFSGNETKKDNYDNLPDNERIIGTWMGNLDAKDQVYYDYTTTVEIKRFVFSENTAIYDIYMNGVKEIVKGNYTISPDTSLYEQQGISGGILFIEYHENGFVFMYVFDQGYLNLNNAIFTRQ